jgi:hypothetical protein
VTFTEQTKEEMPMKILKRRDKLDKTITIRVPGAMKTHLDELRQRADPVGLDVGATLRESLTITIRQIRAELDALERNPIQPADALTDGVDHNLTTSVRVKTT